MHFVATMLMWTIAMCIILVAWRGEQVSSNEFVGLIASSWNSNKPNQDLEDFFHC
jgi:hypothetical protein